MLSTAILKDSQNRSNPSQSPASPRDEITYSQLTIMHCHRHRVTRLPNSLSKVQIRPS